MNLPLHQTNYTLAYQYARGPGPSRAPHPAHRRVRRHPDPHSSGRRPVIGRRRPLGPVPRRSALRAASARPYLVWVAGSNSAQAAPVCARSALSRLARLSTAVPRRSHWPRSAPAQPPFRLQARTTISPPFTPPRPAPARPYFDLQARLSADRGGRRFGSHYHFIKLRSSIDRRRRRRKMATMMARPTATSAAATAMTKNTMAWPS
jgi:hypothetical protein